MALFQSLKNQSKESHAPITDQEVYIIINPRAEKATEMMETKIDAPCIFPASTATIGIIMFADRGERCYMKLTQDGLEVILRGRYGLDVIILDQVIQNVFT